MAAFVFALLLCCYNLLGKYLYLRHEHSTETKIPRHCNPLYSNSEGLSPQSCTIQIRKQDSGHFCSLRGRELENILSSFFHPLKWA